ncbi:hypothetical protein [Paenibacillus validus]|uniref:hypothetical protein n=1 Tax=Paenibacillus validus TaxID=44253 RepID=UPI003D290F7A
MQFEIRKLGNSSLPGIPEARTGGSGTTLDKFVANTVNRQLAPGDLLPLSPYKPLVVL